MAISKARFTARTTSGLPVIRPQSRIWPVHSRANTTGHFRSNPAPPAVISGL
jgi:hypothetical protein